VRADSLERAVKDEAAKVLANPELILAEAERLNSNGGHQAASEKLSKEVNGLDVVNQQQWDKSGPERIAVMESQR